MCGWLFFCLHAPARAGRPPNYPTHICTGTIRPTYSPMYDQSTTYVRPMYDLPTTSTARVVKVDSKLLVNKIILLIKQQQQAPFNIMQERVATKRVLLYLAFGRAEAWIACKCLMSTNFYRYVGVSLRAK